MPKSSKSVVASTNNAVIIDELYGNGGFNPKPLQELFKYITGKEGAKISEVESMVTGDTDASVIRSNVSLIEGSQKDIVVTINGIQWSLVYLTTASGSDGITADGDVVATFVSADNVGTGPVALTNSSGIDNNYPSNMYSTTYIRAVVFNNGGEYLDENRKLVSARQDASSDWADFTMSSVSPLAEFIVKPANVAYQATESWYATGDKDHNLPNDAYEEASGAWYSSSLNFAKLYPEHYGDWKNDNIWLPSLCEFGYNDNNSLWKTSSYQRSASAQYWTRSGNRMTVNSNDIITAIGTNGYVAEPTKSLGYRVGFHLNLSKLGYYYSDVETTYNGEAQTLDGTAIWFNSDVMTANYLQSPMVNVGSYKVEVSLIPETINQGVTWADGTTGTKQITFTIKPKALQISWATQNHIEGDGGDSFYFILPTLNVTPDVKQYLNEEVKYYLQSDYNTSTGTATGSPVTALEEGKNYYAVVELKDGLSKENYEFSGNPYYAFNTTDNRTAVVITIENSGQTYDGKPHAATASAKKTDGTPLVVGTDIEFLLTYYKDGDSVYENGSTVAPTNAGTYKLVVSIKPTYNEEYKPYDTMEFEYVIEKADPVCNPVRKTNGTLYAGSALPELAIGNVATDTAGTYEWDAGQRILSGENEYGYTFTPEDTDNYKTVTGKFTLTGVDANVRSISAVFTLPDGVTIYDSFSLDDLMQYLKVSGELDNGEKIEELYGYTITGTLTEGNSTLTVHYGENDITCQFTVEGVVACVFEGITADFSQDGKVYTSTDLDDLKSMLTVKGKYSDGRDYGAIDGTAYDLSIDNPDGLVAGTATINVSYWHEDGNEYTATFSVKVMPVVLESISAVFNPGLNEIKSSTSLEKLKSWLTVKGTNNDGTDFGEISADDYTLTGTLKSGTASTITVKYQGKSTTFTVDVLVSPDDELKTPIPVPELKEISYTGSEIDILQGWAHIGLVTVTGNKYTDADTYDIIIVINDPDTYKWDTSGLTPVASTRATVKYALAEEFVGYVIDGDTLTAKWKIAPAVLKGTWNSSGTLDVVSSSYKGSTDGLFTYTYFDADGNEVTKFVEGETYTVTAELADTKNFVLDGATEKLLEGEHEFTVPMSGPAALWNNIKAFMTGTLWNLPVWAWFLIGLAVLILLIIIIAVACKRRKSKEEKAEAKARKEEERQRREEERQMQKERLEAERELAKAKQEAELEKIRAQAGMGMATMSMPMAQQVQPQQAQQPVQQVQTADNSAMLRLEMEMAEIRAKLSAVQQQAPAPQQQSAPQYTVPSGGNDMIALLHAQLAEMRAEQNSMRAEQNSALKTELEIMKLRMEQKQQYALPPQLGDALVAAFTEFVTHGHIVHEQPAPTVPQIAEESTQSVPAQYPSDAVITTTTTVDTTKSKPASLSRKNSREERSEFTDVDGFYDEI